MGASVQKDSGSVTGLIEKTRLPAELLLVLGFPHFPITNNIKVMTGEEWEVGGAGRRCS